MHIIKTENRRLPHVCNSAKMIDQKGQTVDNSYDSLIPLANPVNYFMKRGFVPFKYCDLGTKSPSLFLSHNWRTDVYVFIGHAFFIQYVGICFTESGGPCYCHKGTIYMPPNRDMRIRLFDLSKEGIERKLNRYFGNETISTVLDVFTPQWNEKYLFRILKQHMKS